MVMSPAEPSSPALDNVLARPAEDPVDSAGEADDGSEVDDLMEEQTGGRS